MGGLSLGHEENFPREFITCGQCGKKGVYQIRGQYHDRAGPDDPIDLVTVVPPMLRCKFCKAECELPTKVPRVES